MTLYISLLENNIIAIYWLFFNTINELIIFCLEYVERKSEKKRQYVLNKSLCMYVCKLFY